MRATVAAPNPPATGHFLPPCPPEKNHPGLQVFFKPSPLYLPLLSCPGALPAETPDFRSLSCFDSSSPFPWKAGSICPRGAASPGDTACSQHRLKRRKSHEATQRVVKVFPSHHLKGTKGFPIPRLSSFPILESFSHGCFFLLSHWKRRRTTGVGWPQGHNGWLRWRKGGEEPPPWG